MYNTWPHNFENARKTVEQQQAELAQKDKAKELYERALQEVGIIESELDHTNSEMVRKELENQLQYLKR